MRIRYTPPIPYYKNGKYTVKAGDNYWNIAKELGMNYRDLM